jgi:hypothetical protein
MANINRRIRSSANALTERQVRALLDIGDGALICTHTTRPASRAWVSYEVRRRSMSA